MTLTLCSRSIPGPLAPPLGRSPTSWSRSPSICFLAPPLAGGAHPPPIASWERAQRGGLWPCRSKRSLYCPCPWCAHCLSFTLPVGSKFSKLKRLFHSREVLWVPGPELEINSSPMEASRVLLFLLDFCEFTMMFPVLPVIYFFIIGLIAYL